MPTAHRIELKPTENQRQYFARACGTSRLVWNWALAEWNRQFEAGQRPNAMALKKKFNAIKYQQYPWLADVHRDAHAQPFAHLGRAYGRFFADLKTGARIALDNWMERKPLKKTGVELAFMPRFKKKGQCVDSFYVANDKFEVVGINIKLPKIGIVRMTESLRYGGKILGGAVSREADRWFVALQIEVEVSMLVPKDRRERIGVDLNTGSIDLSNGVSPTPPKPLKVLGDGLKRLQKKASHKMACAKLDAGIPRDKAIPRGVRLKTSNNLIKANKKIAKKHARISRIRKDFLHKTTTQLCRENQAITVEDLNVHGMTASSRGDNGNPGKKAGLTVRFLMSALANLPVK